MNGVHSYDWSRALERNAGTGRNPRYRMFLVLFFFFSFTYLFFFCIIIYIPAAIAAQDVRRFLHFYFGLFKWFSGS